jgi:hypothetical protein
MIVRFPFYAAPGAFLHVLCHATLLVYTCRSWYPQWSPLFLSGGFTIMVRRFLFSHDWRFSVGVTYTRPLSSLVRPVMSKYEMIHMHNYILISDLVRVRRAVSLFRSHRLQWQRLDALRALQCSEGMPFRLISPAGYSRVET